MFVEPSPLKHPLDEEALSQLGRLQPLGHSRIWENLRFDVHRTLHIRRLRRATVGGTLYPDRHDIETGVYLTRPHSQVLYDGPPRPSSTAIPERRPRRAVVQVPAVYDRLLCNHPIQHLRSILCTSIRVPNRKTRTYTQLYRSRLALTHFTLTRSASEEKT